MKSFFSIVTVYFLATSFFFTPIAKAESTTGTAATSTSLPNEVANIFSILEPLILKGAGLPTSLVLGGCTPSISFGFFSADLTFASSATCPLNGTVALTLFPLGDNVNLEIMNNPFLTAISGNFAISGSIFGGVNLTWTLSNASVSFRLDPIGPLSTWDMTGTGNRKRTNGILTVNSRVNFFDGATGNGYALLRTVTSSGQSLQACTLTGATSSNVNSGTTSACVQLP